ncbi:MAG: ATP-binding cassette domain-containing protein [Acidaminococcaceae bacterium]
MLKIKAVSYRYAGRKQGTLHNINLTIQSGEMVLIAGRTGCGKSTLIKVINGLLAASSKGDFKGQVSIDATDIATLRPEKLGLMVGTVYQSPDDQLFAMTVEDEVAFILENQGMAADVIRVAVHKTLAQVGLAGLEKRGIHALSGGQRQRLALASVLVSKPRILILDEPVSQMNSSSVVEFLHLLQQLNVEAGITIIVVEHRVHELAQYFPRLVVMNKGSIIFDGDINAAWAAIGTKEDYGLREPQNVKLCRTLKLPHLEMATTAVVEQIKTHCCLHGYTGKKLAIQVFEREPVLTGVNVSFAYPGSKKNVLQGINLHLQRGEIVVLMGYNGAGKSTLLNLIAGLTAPSTGELQLWGGEVAANAQRLAFLRQDPDLMLLADTVQEEVLWKNQRITASEADILLKKLDLYDKKGDFPLALSKGQRLRVVLASLLARKPEIILLDEPTTGQDQQSLLDIRQLVTEFAQQGGSVLLCTHDVELATELADRVLLMYEGHIVASGTPLTILGNQVLLQKVGLVNPPMLNLSTTLGIGTCTTIQEVKHYVDEAVVGRL